MAYPRDTPRVGAPPSPPQARGLYPTGASLSSSPVFFARCAACRARRSCLLALCRKSCGPYALGVAVQMQGKPAVAALIAALPKTTDAALRNGILGGLAHVEDPTLATRVRDFALDQQVKVGEMGSLLMGGRDTAAGRDAMWQWFTTHYKQVLGRTGSFAGGYLPRLAAGGGCSTPEVERLQAFFEPRMNDAAGIARGLAQTGESIQLCAALKGAQDPAAILR